MFAHGETVTRLRGTSTTDPYSGEATTTSWTSPASLSIDGCGIADGGSVEPVEDARDSVRSDFDVITPADADVRSGDRLVVRGLTCEVEGRPFPWRNPFTGWAPGMVVRCKIVEG